MQSHCERAGRENRRIKTMNIRQLLEGLAKENLYDHHTK